MVTTGCIGQTKPRPEVHLESDSFTYYKEYAVGYSLSIRRSIYGKVRIVTDANEEATLQVHFVKPGEIHHFNVKVVNRKPKDGEWQFVTKKGEEDFTIRVTDPFAADVLILKKH